MDVAEAMDLGPCAVERSEKSPAASSVPAGSAIEDAEWRAVGHGDVDVRWDVEVVLAALVLKRPIAILRRVLACVDAQPGAVGEVERIGPLGEILDAVDLGVFGDLQDLLIHGFGIGLDRIIITAITIIMAIIRVVKRQIVIPCNYQLQRRVQASQHVKRLAHLVWPSALAEIAAVEDDIRLREGRPEAGRVSDWSPRLVELIFCVGAIVLLDFRDGGVSIGDDEDAGLDGGRR